MKASKLRTMFWGGWSKEFYFNFLVYIFFPLECTSVGLNCFDSVHLLLCNNFNDLFFFFLFLLFLNMAVWVRCGRCLPWYCCPSPPPPSYLTPCSQVRKWECQMSFKLFLVVHLGFFFFFSLSLQISSHCVFRGQGVKKMQSHSTQ